MASRAPSTLQTQASAAGPAMSVVSDESQQGTAAASSARSAPVPKADAAAKSPISLPVMLGAGLGGGALLLGAGIFAFVKLARRGQRKQPAVKSKKGSSSGATEKGPFSGLKATSKCVPLADGSACVVRRPIPADNSCMFNAVGYVMHHSKTKASFLRSVVAREVSSDPKEYSDAFLGMSNLAYCNWIMNKANWGGGIELSIMAKHYAREISAWNIESATGLVFGEEAGYTRMVMLIYNGIHYDALAVCQGPKASEADDITEFNPRTKRGKLIIAAAKKLVELTHKGSQFVSNSPRGTFRLRCTDCKSIFSNQAEATKHAEATGHTHYDQVK